MRRHKLSRYKRVRVERAIHDRVQTKPTLRGSKVFIIYSVLFENDTTEDKLVGIFRVPAKMRNWQNRFLPPEKQGTRGLL